MITILAEKPDQGRKLAAPFPHKKGSGFISIEACNQFPKGAKVTWAIGHLVELKNPDEYKPEWKKWSLKELPIIPESFQYKVSKDKESQYKIVKGLLKEADEIIIATDPAREGENIARLLIMMAGCSNKPIKRLWTSSLTENAIKKSFTELRDGDSTINMFHEAQARQISDWLIGLNASRLYTIHLQNKGLKDVFSVGRVQTPVLTLIYNRQQEIENFKSEPFIELAAEFTGSTGTYSGKHKGRYPTKDALYAAVAPHIHNGTNSYSGEVRSVEVNEKRVKPPELNSLSTLQAKLNQKYKYSPSDVLKTVQELYDKGFASYPRTDSQHITSEEFNYLKTYLPKYQEKLNVTFSPSRLEAEKRYVNPDKVSDHYAIIPTDTIPSAADLAGFTDVQKKVYEEILKSALAIFMDDYVYEETVIATHIGEIEFNTKGKVERALGWKALYAADAAAEDTEDEDDNGLLPAVQQGMPVNAKTLLKEGTTKPPALYTQGQLITLMKTAGKHVDDKEMRQALHDSEGLGTEATRSSIIETLVARKFIEVKKNKVSVTEKGKVLCRSVEGTILSKPEMTAQWEIFLREIGKGNKSKDTFIENTKKLCYKLLEQSQTDMAHVDASAVVQAAAAADHIAKCPCGKGHIVEKPTFYSCTAYKEGCKISFPKKLLEKKLTATNIKHLCEKGQTSKIKGFKSKAGKEFDAAIAYKEGKIEFVFS